MKVSKHACNYNTYNGGYIVEPSNGKPLNYNSAQKNKSKLFNQVLKQDVIKKKVALDRSTELKSMGRRSAPAK